MRRCTAAKNCRPVDKRAPVFTGRGSQLAQKVGVPPKELLILALTHELGHAVCRDTSETGAERFAEEIRRKRPGRCDIAAMPVWGYRLPPGK